VCVLEREGEKERRGERGTGCNREEQRGRQGVKMSARVCVHMCSVSKSVECVYVLVIVCVSKNICLLLQT
jgi:hypothetical protein